MKKCISSDFDSLFLPVVIIPEPVCLEAGDNQDHQAHQYSQPPEFIHAVSRCLYKCNSMPSRFSLPLTFINLKTRCVNFLPLQVILVLKKITSYEESYIVLHFNHDSSHSTHTTKGREDNISAYGTITDRDQRRAGRRTFYTPHKNRQV